MRALDMVYGQFKAIKEQKFTFKNKASRWGSFIAKSRIAHFRLCLSSPKIGKTGQK